VKLALLSLLYFAEGLPFGFQSLTLPIYLRESGRSLVAIGFLGALSLPWMLKPLWAPLVDGYGATRRAWILPLLAGVAASCAAAGLADPTTGAGLAALLALVFAMNLFAATLDIAVDGLAVDLLERRELGGGNAAQVVGYKVGMMTGGGLFVWASAYLPWRLLLAVMGGIVLLVMLAAALAPATRTRAVPPQRLGAVVSDLVRALRAPGSAGLLLFLVTYKLGETMAGVMWKPFLVDAGFDKPFIGQVTSVYGMAASIAGSLAGGWLAWRLPLRAALLIPAVARLLPMAAQIFVVMAPTRVGVVAVACGENFAGGALTTVVFAAMMARVDRRIGASHYTALAAVEVAGKLPGGWISGPIAQWLGYPALYLIATLATVAVIVPIVRLREAGELAAIRRAPPSGS
jgi:MFS family permease